MAGRCCCGRQEAQRSCGSVAINVRTGTEAEALAKANGLPTLYDAAGPLDRRAGGFDLGRKPERASAGRESVRCPSAAGRSSCA